METCKSPNIAEHLTKLLSPSDFPGEIEAIEEHLKDCPACREEWHQLRRVDEFLGAHRDLLCEALSPCPPVETLTEFAMAETGDPAVEQHLAVCPDCREHVRLVRELAQENLQIEDASVSPRERVLFREAVSREYGPVEEPGPGLGERMLETLRSWLQVPSLALGAAIATLVMVFLVPHGPKEAPLMLAVSNVVWEKPSLAGKEGFVPKEEPLGKKKVALILLTRGETQPPLPHVDEMYSKLDIAKRLAAAYDFLSPKEIKDALSGAQISGNLMAVADLVFEKIPADYVLAFEILESTTGNAVQGTLYQRGRQTDCGSISQTGLPISRMPSRITSMGVELLLEAEQS